MNDLLIAATSFLLSWAAVAGIRQWARRRGILDIPNERSSHREPVPRGGGAAIVATVVIGMLIPLITRQASSPRLLVAWIAGSILIASISAVDDLRSLPTSVRLLAQATAALLVIVAAGPLAAIGHPSLGFLPFSGARYLLTLFWIVGLTNAFNFMDGIDGIAGGQAAVAAATAAIVGHMQNEPTIEVLGILITAASIGFLVHNWSPATIFMGDVGSAFLGYSLAVVPLMAHRSRPELLLDSVIALWPFLFDSTFTFARRLLKGENVMRAHRSHLYQRLVATGLSHGTVALLYVFMSVLPSALAIVNNRSSLIGAGISIAMMASALCVLVRIREARTQSAQRVRAYQRPAGGES